MDNETLVEKLKVILATAHAFALKAQNYHWNVTGPHFLEYHEFFGDIYEQVSGDTDAYAEFIRQLGMFAPGSLTRFAELSRIKDELTIPASGVMFIRLQADNGMMIALLKGLHDSATEAKNFALTSFIEERLQYHEKLAWMITSLLVSPLTS
jgi:starvation-inducible DNA-binding protein